MTVLVNLEAQRNAMHRNSYNIFPSILIVLTNPTIFGSSQGGAPATITIEAICGLGIGSLHDKARIDIGILHEYDAHSHRGTASTARCFPFATCSITA